MSAHITLNVADGVAHLQLNRPEKLNALDAKMVDALLDKCRQIERGAAKVVILSGAGKAFCAGGDIEAWSSIPPQEFGRFWLRHGHMAFDALARLRQPVIAVLDGHCLGGGLELAACADYRIAEQHIKIGQPETGLGIIPGWSGTQRAVRRFGVQIVRRMALFGEVFTAPEALDLGIVDKITATGGAMVAAQVAARDVMKRGPLASELCKMLINVAEGEETERVVEALAGIVAAGSNELTEGLTAFREKRSPKFGEDQ